MIGVTEELIIFYTLALALLFGKFFEELISRTGFPPVLGNLIAGLILGPSFLGIYMVTDSVKAIAWFGVALLLFYAGLETRYSDFIKLVPTAGILTLGEAISAFSMGFLVGYILGYNILQSFFLGAILEATSVSLTVRSLIEIKKFDTIEGYTIMEIAVLDDLSSLITIAIGTSLVILGALNVVDVAKVFIESFGLWILLLLILHRFADPIVRISRRLHIEEAPLAIIIALFAGTATLVGLVGISPLVGAYVTGIALSEIRGLKEIRDVVRKMAIIFSTIFFVTTAAQLNIWQAFRLDLVPFYILMIIAAFVGKLLGSGLTSIILGFPLRSALRIATGLFPRCEFAIIAAYSAVNFHILGSEAYLAALIVVLVTNIVTPPIIKVTFSGPDLERVKLRFPRKVLEKHFITK
ncbi:MAG: cation:proton antiporter [Desulfurococcales archaeon]|nr:cation:proton antiporter [Desulfurococcales archaeon]